MSGSRNKQSYIPKPVYRDYPGQNVPGAYPDTPKVSPGEDSSHKKPSSFKDDAHQSHLGHDHRSAKKVDFSTPEQPSGAREGVASLPGSSDAGGATVFPGERKPAERRTQASAGSGDNNYRAIEELYCSQTLDVVNPIAPPINCKSPDTLPMIIGDADDLQHQNPIPPPHATSSYSDYQRSLDTSGNSTPASISRESLSKSKSWPPLTTSEYDLYGERLDTDQFVYEDDETADSDTPHLMFLKDRKKKADGLKTSSPLGEHPRERRGTAVGCDGVEYYTDGKDGILPGYPTPRGVNTLIANRINDDLQQSQGNPSTKDDESKLNHMIHGESTASTKAVSGSHSSAASENDQYIDDNGMVIDDPMNDNRIIEEKRDVLRESPMDATPSQNQKAVQPQGRHYVAASQKFPFPDASPDIDEDAETMNRNIEEQREIPIFRDGGDTATGKFEAIYAPVTGKPEELREQPVFPDGSKTAAGKYEGTFVSEDFATLPSNGPGGSTYYGQVAQGKDLYGRNPQERREEPIFRDGGDTAAGRFEAKYVPVTGQPEEVAESPVFNNPNRDTAAGRYEATFVPERFPPEPEVLSSGQEALTTTGQGPTDVVDELPDELRDPRERREVPIFSGGGDTAAGKFEAVFEPEGGQSREPNRDSRLYQQKGAAYRAGNEPLAKSKEMPAFNSRTESELRGSVSYLGKPISKAEQEAQIERARSMARRKAGIN